MAARNARSSHSVLWYRRGGLPFFLPSFIAFVVLGAAIWRIDEYHLREHRDMLRVEVSRDVGRLGANLKANIAGNVNLVAGLAAAVAIEPDMDEHHFNQLASRILEVKSQLRYLSIAPDLILKLAYPIKGHETAIGYDFRKSKSGIRSAERARDSGKVTFAVPFKMERGGLGLFARYPIFQTDSNGQKVFWGIASALMDLERLKADSGLLEPDLGLDITLARAETATAPFFGDAAVLADDPVVLPIDLGYDKWLISAVPKGGWSKAPPDLMLRRLYAGTALVAIVSLLLAAGILLNQRQRHITTLQQREQQFETLSKRHEAALEASGIGIWEYDEGTGELIWDSRMRDLYGLRDDDGETGYQTWLNALHPDDRIKAEATFSEAIIRRSAYTTDFRIILADGTIRHIRAHGRVFVTAQGSNRIVGANWNVTKDLELQAELRDAHARAEEQNRQLEAATRSLAHLSSHDALTGLPNRRYFDTFLADATETGTVSFLHVDLDRFKDINDTFGHAAGDDVLMLTASRLQALLQEAEFAARIGGDEFVIVTHGNEDRVRILAEQALAALFEPMALSHGICRIGGSIGVATRAAWDEPLRQLLASADAALYEAKRLGRNRIQYFTAELRATGQTEKRRMDDVARAFTDDEFFPMFQLQFDAVTHEPGGVEVLARWHHPLQGVLEPEAFLDVAASLNKVAAIDAMVFEKALAHYIRWVAAGIQVPKMSVTVSLQRLLDCSFLKRLAEVRLPGGKLSIRLPASVSFEADNLSVLEKIQQIKALGHEIEIGDFGSGRASISDLLAAAPNRLTIDRDLIAPILTSVPQRRLVASMIEIGRSLGVEIIAEGVDTPTHAELLGELGCHLLQGAAFAAVMTSDEFIPFMRQRATASTEEARRA